MRFARLVLAALAASCLAGGGCRRENARAEVDAASSTATTAKASIADARRAIAGAKVPGLGFAAVTRAREVAIGGEGLADVAAKIDATGETVFEAASIAKLIVVVCIMQMVEEKRLDLDEAVAKYVGFPVRHPQWPEAITLRLLLTHTGSIRDRLDTIGAAAENNPLGGFLESYFVKGKTPRADAFLDGHPGASMRYSNVGAALAAFAIEHTSGESFAEVSRRRVFEPLGMTSTGWTAAARAARVVATPHAYRDGAFVALPQASHAVYPAVDLRSSARDLGRFARAILRDGELDGTRILSAASVHAMTDRPAGQLLIWQDRTLAGARIIGHEGEDAGATTALFLDVAAGTGAVVLANGDAFSSGDPARAQAVQALLSDLLVAGR